MFVVCPPIRFKIANFERYFHKLISSPCCAVAGFVFIFVLNSLLTSQFGNSVHEVF